MQTKPISCLFALLFLIYTTSCANDNTTVDNNNSDTTKLPPVETKKANSNYSPAFKGQTRVAGVKTATAYKVDKVAEKLGRPWAVIALPDGRLLITEKTGYMQIHTAAGALVKKNNRLSCS